MKKTWVVFLALLAIVTICGAAYADCPDGKILCVKIINGKIYNNGIAQSAGGFTTGQCFKNWECQYCQSWEDLARECTNRFSADCASNTCAACRAWSDSGGLYGDCYNTNGKGVPLY